MSERYCPLCEKQLDADVCPEHGVPTIDAAVFKKDEREVFEPGDVVAGRFRVDRLLGKGAMGSVFEAVQLSMERKVALKTLQEAFHTDTQVVRRFYLEARAASQLEHPNIVKIYDFGVDDESKVPYIAMEYLEGEAMGALLDRETSVTEIKACELLSQVSKALVEAHGKGIVHRDLKPDNIQLRPLADGDMQCKVLDFGIAKVLSGGSESMKSLTATGMTMGTAHYMPPEQIRGDKVDFRADLYALGCILHELVSGQRPYGGEERLAILMQHLSAPPPALPATLIDGNPPSDNLRAIHYALLAKDREHRPTDTAVPARIFTAMATGESINAAQILAQDNAAAGAMGTDQTMAAMSVVDIGGAGTSPSQSSIQTVSGAGLDGTQMAGTVDMEAAGLTGSSGRRALYLAVAAVFLLAGGLGLMQFMKPAEQTHSLDQKPVVRIIKETIEVESEKSQEVEKKQNAMDDDLEASGFTQGADGKWRLDPNAPKKEAKPEKPKEPVLPKHKVKIETTPLGATVKAGESILGMTPMSITLAEGQESRTITVVMEGYNKLSILATRDTDKLALTLKKPSKKPSARIGRGRSSKRKRSTASPSAPAPPPKAKAAPKKKALPVW
jgi:hypothetical protein